MPNDSDPPTASRGRDTAPPPAGGSFRAGSGSLLCADRRQRRPTPSSAGSRVSPLNRVAATIGSTCTQPTHEIFDQFKQQLPDIDPVETQEWIESLDALVEAAGPGSRALHHLQAAETSPPAAGRPADADPDPLHQHHQPGAGALLPRRRGDGAQDPAPDPLERAGHGAAGQHAVRGDRWAPVDVRQRRHPVRGRLQPLLPRQRRRARAT